MIHYVKVEDKGSWTKGAYCLPRAIVLCFLLFAVCQSALVQAQEAVQWSEPINLSNTMASSTYPTIATDSYGGLHVFWSEEYLGELPKEEEVPEVGDTIYYTYWDGQSWSEPIDLFFTEGPFYNYPVAVADRLVEQRRNGEAEKRRDGEERIGRGEGTDPVLSRIGRLQAGHGRRAAYF